MGLYARHSDVGAGKGTLLLGEVFIYCILSISEVGEPSGSRRRSGS